LTCYQASVARLTICAALVLCQSGYSAPAQALPVQKPHAAAPTKTLKFPTKAPLAQLYCYYPASSLHPDHPVETRILAQGNVTIPTDIHISLKLLYAGLEQLALLKQINANQVTKLDSAGLEFDDSHMEQLKDFTSIWRINLDSTSITDKTIPILAKFKGLRDLRLSKVDITGGNFELLSGLPIHIINLNGSNLKEGNLGRIKNLPETLDNLNVSRTDIGPRDIALISKCKKLTSLNIGGCNKITDQCMKSLLGLKMLDDLYVEDTQVTEKSLAIFAQMPNLHKVIVRNKTFWKLGQGKSPRADLVIEDSVSQSRTPVDVFGPLH